MFTIGTMFVCSASVSNAFCARNSAPAPAAAAHRSTSAGGFFCANSRPSRVPAARRQLTASVSSIDTSTKSGSTHSPITSAPKRSTA